jgi:dTDP-4-dehydrorhamnose 3,5-epimerase
VIYRELTLSGAYVLEPERHADERGFFARVFDLVELAGRGLFDAVVEGSIAWNARAGTVRGMHFQFPPHAEVKLVRCTRGAVHDVIVDLRPESPTFGRSEAVQLDEDSRLVLLVPKRFAHGYQTLVDDTEVEYQMDAGYAPEFQSGLHYGGIEWPLPPTVVSPRDQALPAWADAEAELRRRMA